MNTQQLQHILSSDPHVAPLFFGVFPRDKLPSYKEGVYVINTDPAGKPGEHWVAIYSSPSCVEYFDSYGGDPSIALRRWWKKTWIANPIPLQSPLSAVCGQYCIYFLLHRARGIDMSTILMDFGPDVDYNDQMVYDFVDERYGLENLKLVDTNGLIMQLARAQTSDPSIRKLVSGQ